MLVYSHPFQDSFLHIHLNVSFHPGPEMHRDQFGLLATIWYCLWLGVNLHWFACGDWQPLSLTLVESRGLEVVSDPCLQCWDVALCSWPGKLLDGSAKLRLGHEPGRSDSGSHSPMGWWTAAWLTSRSLRFLRSLRSLRSLRYLRSLRSLRSLRYI